MGTATPPCSAIALIEVAEQPSRTNSSAAASTIRRRVSCAWRARFEPSEGAVAAYALEADDGERLRFGDVEVVVKASADTTDGAFTIFEENEPGDTRLHVHEHEDELFYVLEREHIFHVGDHEFRAGVS